MVISRMRKKIDRKLSGRILKKSSYLLFPVRINFVFLFLYDLFLVSDWLLQGLFHVHFFKCLKFLF